MSSIEVSGKSYETDEEGYLVNLAEWNEDVGTYLAQTENVEMTDQHWEVTTSARYSNEFQIARVRADQAHGKKLGPTRAPASTCRPVPYGPAKQACKIAGLPSHRLLGTAQLVRDRLCRRRTMVLLEPPVFSLHPASPAF